ncbi:MAG: SDR family NAD(P)-dependent oxidoreductase [Candidatus Sulfotelmatobacter sp.]
MSSEIAIVGMACCYPDANNPRELWENVLAQRRAFRRLPPERLRLEDYFSNDASVPDAIYASEAAVIEGYEFDRVRFRVAGPTFRSVDLAHWLALDVADQALKDAGFVDGQGLPLETTGVLVGNTLTGEFSRAATLRLRWPYVRRVIEARMGAEGWDKSRRSEFLDQLEEEYKAPFPEVGEESLAGALSNTIAGRICNYFHFGGGGYTVDGACSSSLLGVAKACSALEAGELDAALAGGVDLSLDPFELVGFAKAGALAHGEMRIYDKESTGFLPGEGCGFVVLMRMADAIAQHLQIYAVIRGWGISSDGGGGITRPEARGQRLALERAYHRANFGFDSVALIEGHGTGTPVGDEVELKALCAMREAAGGKGQPAAIGSIKANFGHTKAAAGVAGLIKATLAVHHKLLPPTTGTREPRSEVDGEDAMLRVLAEAEPWPADMPVRAGVNSFGFGGINVHVTIAGCEGECRTRWSPSENALTTCPQDVEVFFLDGDSVSELAGKIERLAHLAPNLSSSELTDLSISLAGQAGVGRARASFVAATPAELEECLHKLQGLIQDGVLRHLDAEEGTFLCVDGNGPRVGLLFPGQVSPVRLQSGIHARRFEEIAALYESATFPGDHESGSTEEAQLAIITAELAGLRILERFGIAASVAVGHSLGELAAYCWAGALDESSLLQLVRLRGRLMSRVSGPRGAMASIGASAENVELLVEDGKKVVVACFNAARQTVVSGESEAVAAVVSRAQDRGWTAILLSAADAFHSPLMVPAAEEFRSGLASFELRPLRKTVISTVTGAEIGGESQLRDLLVGQLTSPVQFMQAMSEAKSSADLFIETGPGKVLTHLLKSVTDVPTISLDIAGPSLAGLYMVLGAVYVLGGPVQLEPLIKNRFARPFDFTRQPKFFVNPCELAPVSASNERKPRPALLPEPEKVPKNRGLRETPVVANNGNGNIAHLVRTLVARRTELPPDSIAETARLLRDLHLNSIVVSEIVASAARELGVKPPVHLLSFADSTVVELAQRLEQLRTSQGTAPVQETVPAGIDDWCRTFVVDWTPRALREHPKIKSAPGRWSVFGALDHPLLQTLRETALPGNGVVVCMSGAAIEEQLNLLLTGAHKAIETDEAEKYFVVLGPVAVAGAFARTISLEHPEIFTRVIETPSGSDAVRYLKAELSGSQAHVEARYDTGGERCEPCFRLLAPVKEDAIPIRRGEVVLVSGGAKGIAAECAAALAKEAGAKLVLFGRSEKDDPLVAAHLHALEISGVVASYFQTDITDAQAVRAAVSAAEQMFGPIKGIIHGAGCNQPALVRDLDEAKLRATVAPKVQGFRNLVAAVNSGELRLLATFGSVIGRVGLRGEADYALANASLSALTEEFARLHPGCRCLAFESSAWSGIGMAERLGKVETLRSAGIGCIPPDKGISWFRKLVSSTPPATTVVVTSRLGANSPVPIKAPALPMRRFLERPRVYYPGVELVVEADLTTASDPYLLDHVFHGQPLLPAVMGIEAMVQVAMAVRAETQVPAVEDLRFEHPIVVESGSRVTVRIAALVRETGLVDVVIRSSQTSFQVDHFRCSCAFGDAPIRPEYVAPLPETSLLPLDPLRDLYESLLFQGPRFRRVAGYRRLSARFSSAEIAPASHQASPPQAWFSSYLPGALMLGDAAARDAALHSIQACVPDATLLPVSVDRISPRELASDETLIAHASERWHEGNTYCYDLELRTPEGMLREHWKGLRLRKVEDAKTQDFPDALAAALLEWRVRRAAPASRVFAAFERDKNMDRRRRSERAIQRALGSPWPVRWRADGKPEVAAPMAVSAAHSNGLTLAVAAAGEVGCDLEPICPRAEEVWRDLLGPERWLLAQLIGRQAQEDIHTAATRVWTAMESLAKAGVSQNGPLVLLSSSIDGKGGISLGAPGVTMATSVVRFRRDPMLYAVAVLTRSEECEATSTDIESVLKRRTS